VSNFTYDDGHVWAKHEREGWTVCARCGQVRNFERPPGQCRGAAKIALLEATGGEQGETADELEIVRLRRELAEMTGVATRWCAEAGRSEREHNETLVRARTELCEVTRARDEAIVKLECLDDHRRADSDLIDRLEYALRALVDSVTATKCRDTIVLRDIEAARALIGEGRS
jgi:hypothetical protein